MKNRAHAAPPLVFRPPSMTAPLPPVLAALPVSAPNRWRWIIALALVLLLHLLAIGWGSGQLRPTAPHAAPEPVLDATLLLPPPPPPPAPRAQPTPPPAPARPRPPRPKPPAPKPAPPPVEPATEPPASEIAAAAAPDSAYEVPELPSAAGAGDAAQTPTAPSAASPAEAPPAPPAPRFDPPPSVTLKYDVEAWREGQQVYGHGSIAWQTDGDSYRIVGDAGILFFSLLSFSSEGMIDEHGVAPVLYHEKRFRKSSTNTHFQRQKQIISFSASTATYPRQGGEQDRASVIWQLAAIGRGDPQRFAAGTDIDLFVAGVRDAESWRIHVIGLESIEVDGDTMQAWHVLRAPRPGSYDQKIDIWLAPAHEWYPVKLRYTETSGDYLDLLLTGMRRPPAQAPDTDPGSGAVDSAGTAPPSYDWIN